jgi:hypothetical protein
MGVAAATISLQISREFQVPDFASFAESAMSSSSPDVEERMEYNYGKSTYKKYNLRLCYAEPAREAPGIVECRNGQSDL